MVVNYNVQASKQASKVNLCTFSETEYRYMEIEAIFSYIQMM